jgi:SPP1 gp7 family putative phage head morphogenesis protein
MDHMRGLMAEAKDFVDFRNQCLDAGYQFNINWLKTEYDTFSASAQMAQQWETMTAAGVEVFQFVTAGDDRVRPTHAELDGLTFTKVAAFIKRIWPPLDFNCRCGVIPGVHDRIADDETAGRLVKQNVKNPLFKNHPGIDKVVISDDHPYFNAMPKELDAQKNYGLPSVKKLYNTNQYPARIEMGSEQEYKEWWRDLVTDKTRDDIVVKDKTGVHVLFDSQATPGNTKPATSYFKDHILMRSNEKRWSYAANLTDIVTQPDEIWSARVKGKIVRFYIKYFEDAPITVVGLDKNNVITAETMYELTEARAGEIRRGELIYIKR